jgi:LmbE family N-acetylglucosaminyl deacetylase
MTQNIPTNSARFAAAPLADGGTPANAWTSAVDVPPLDLGACAGLVVVAPHPDDETLGLGALAAQLAGNGVNVRIVSVSDGGAAYPHMSRSDRARLEVRRRSELLRATQILGTAPPTFLGLPDGALSNHEHRLAALLEEILAELPPTTWCAATWRGDGHPDHEAVGRAAATATAHAGATLLEYPIWMWHWAKPRDPAVPWHRARAVPIAQWAARRKGRAIQCFRSQLDPQNPDTSPVLPPVVVQRQTAVGEVVFV